LRGAESGAVAAWRILFFAQLREQPGRLLITLLAIALGVALGAAVFLVNAAALNEFGLATKRLVGEADVVVRGPREGFSEQIFVDLARNPAVSTASPVLELESAVSGHGDTLKVLGLDPFRAATLQPALMGDVGADLFELFRPDAIFLSNSAASALQVDRGGHFDVTVGSRSKSLRVVGILSQSTYSQSLALMDIASAQWLFDKIGKLNRVDLQLVPGTDVEWFRSELSRTLPPGVLAIAPRVERDRAVSATRAYRVNLNMLALVSLSWCFPPNRWLSCAAAAHSPYCAPWD
jgi:putative ABC transport system permease protein